MNSFLFNSWNPWKEFELLNQKLNSAMGRGDLLPASGAVGTSLTPSSHESLSMADWAPKVDISEDPERYLIKADLPEVKKEDVKVMVKDGVLSISGERKLEKEEKSKKYHRIEKSYGTFFRSFRLPEDVDSKMVDANFKEGVLSIQIAKAPSKSPAQIDVKIT